MPPVAAGDCLPNFLIVGAAKCGTTALYEALTRHPEIFLPDLKEPRFLALEAWPQPPTGPGDAAMFAYACQTIESYTALFRGATSTPARGDASADTFYYHESSVPKIRHLLGDPKIIILLRDPATRAFSAYAHLRRDGRETLSFDDGLRSEPGRIESKYEFLWHYHAAGRYLAAVQNFRSNFSDVLVMEFEDFIADPSSQLREAYRFLGVRSDLDRPVFKRVNRSGLPRWRNLFDLVKKPSPWKAPLKAVLPAVARRRLKDQLLGAMLRPLEKEEALLDLLAARYEDEADGLAQLLGRVPSWLAKRSRSTLPQSGRR